MPSSISTDPCHRVADALRRLSILLPQSGPNGNPVLVDTAILSDLLLSIAEDLDPALSDASDSSQDSANEPARVEVCTCVEWVRDNDLDHDGIDENDLDEATNTYISAVMTGLADKGFEVVSAKGQRKFFHGWNGAHFTERFGCVASWNPLTDEQREIIVAVRISAQKQTTEIWKS